MHLLPAGRPARCRDAGRRLCRNPFRRRYPGHARGRNTLGRSRRNGRAEHDAFLFRQLRAVHFDDEGHGGGHLGRHGRRYVYGPGSAEYAPDPFPGQPEHGGFPGKQFLQPVGSAGDGGARRVVGHDDLLGAVRMRGRRQQFDRRPAECEGQYRIAAQPCADFGGESPERVFHGEWFRGLQHQCFRHRGALPSPRGVRMARLGAFRDAAEQHGGVERHPRRDDRHAAICLRMREYGRQTRQRDSEGAPSLRRRG